MIRLPFVPERLSGELEAKIKEVIATRTQKEIEKYKMMELAKKIETGEEPIEKIGTILQYLIANQK